MTWPQKNVMLGNITHNIFLVAKSNDIRPRLDIVSLAYFFSTTAAWTFVAGRLEPVRRSHPQPWTLVRRSFWSRFSGTSHSLDTVSPVIWSRFAGRIPAGLDTGSPVIWSRFAGR